MGCVYVDSSNIDMALHRHARGDGVSRRRAGFCDPNGEGQLAVAGAHPLVHIHGWQEVDAEAAEALAV